MGYKPVSGFYINNPRPIHFVIVGMFLILFGLFILLGYNLIGFAIIILGIVLILVGYLKKKKGSWFKPLKKLF